MTRRLERRVLRLERALPGRRLLQDMSDEELDAALRRELAAAGFDPDALEDTADLVNLYQSSLISTHVPSRAGRWT